MWSFLPLYQGTILLHLHPDNEYRPSLPMGTSDSSQPENEKICFGGTTSSVPNYQKTIKSTQVNTNLIGLVSSPIADGKVARFFTLTRSDVWDRRRTIAWSYFWLLLSSDNYQHWAQLVHLHLRSQSGPINCPEQANESERDILEWDRMNVR